MILLDTHAAIWLAQDHRRAKPLQRYPRLFLSPATILEVQFLAEAGRVKFEAASAAALFADDYRWRLDEPPAAKWFAAAGELSWTRDPFDRLLAAHARLRRWKLATADALLLEHLPASETLPL